MSHFKYEINERNLRLQLKENLIPFSEEAWQKFENFSAAQNKFNPEGGMKRFSVSLNRNIVLPVVFGSVIVLFSVLLFNFVNIKNPNDQITNDATPVAPLLVKSTIPDQQESNIPSPAQKDMTPIVAKDSVIQTTQAEIKSVQPETSNVVTPVEKPVIHAQKSNEVMDSGIAKADFKPELSKPEKSITNTDTTPNQGVEAPKKKKKQKRQLIVTEPTSEEDQQAPPPVSQNSATSDGQFQ